MYLRIFAFLIFFPFLGQAEGQVDNEAQAKAAAGLRARIEATPTLPFDGVRFTVHGSPPGWKPGLVSWLVLADQLFPNVPKLDGSGKTAQEEFK
jgi:hypothetical protein